MYYLSESDLKLIDGYVEGLDKSYPSVFIGILWKHGLDTKKEVNEEIVQHSNLQKQIVTCRRFVGEERTDQAWLNSGYASVDAHINSSGDKSLKEELKGLNREGFSGDIYEDMVERASKRPQPILN